jgi:predicted amidohydrolase
MSHRTPSQIQASIVFALATVLAFFCAAAAGAALAQELPCAIVQYTVQDQDATGSDVERISAMIREAAGKGAKLVVCPESALHRFWPLERNGVTMLQLGQEVEALETHFSALAKELGVAIVIGVREPSTSETHPVHNTALFFGPDGTLLGRHRKVVVATLEYDFTQPGRQADGDATSFDTPFGRVGMLIGKDMATKYWPNIIAGKGLDLFIGLFADPEPVWSKIAHTCVRARCPGIAANQHNEGEGDQYGGGSAFVSGSGQKLADAGTGEKILYFTIK